jgi:hypothetical protein
MVVDGGPLMYKSRTKAQFVHYCYKGGVRLVSCQWWNGLHACNNVFPRFSTTSTVFPKQARCACQAAAYEMVHEDEAPFSSPMSLST